MGSTRLPGKVLMDLGGKTVLARVVRRLRRATRIDEIVVATTNSIADDGNHSGMPSSQGRIFSRLRERCPGSLLPGGAACAAGVVVRITSDCPVIDPQLVDETDRSFSAAPQQITPATYSHGLIPGAWTPRFSPWRHLNRPGAMLTKPYEREHVTPYFYQHPELFRLASLRGQIDYSQYRWTLDTAEDLELLRDHLCPLLQQRRFRWSEVIALMEREPELAELNSHVDPKSTARSLMCPPSLFAPTPASQSVQGT